MFKQLLYNCLYINVIQSNTMSEDKEKKMDKPMSIKIKKSTKEAIDRACQREDRSASYIIEQAVRRVLASDLKG